MTSDDHLKILVTDKQSGEIICSCCGQVVEEKTLDQTTHGFETDQSSGMLQGRDFTTIMRHDRGMTTKISGSLFLKKQDVKSKNYIYKLKLWQNRITKSNGKERRLGNILVQIRAIGGKMALPSSLQEDAAYMATKWVAYEESSRRLVPSVAAALLFLASRRSRMPRQAKDFIAEIGSHHRYFWTIYGEIKDKLGIDLDSSADPAFPIISMICKELEIPASLERKAYALVSMWRNDITSQGKSPKTIALIALAFYARFFNGCITKDDVFKYSRGFKKFTQREMLDVLGIKADNYVSKNLKEIRPFIEKNWEALKL